jgi:hypothetical protein
LPFPSYPVEGILVGFSLSRQRPAGSKTDRTGRKFVQEAKSIADKAAPLKKDDSMVITGAGCFIGGNPAR